ncbi:MAG: hypothetical protein NTY59_01180 [Alphaproteobacteria bacterium]|nr:hypothetical protein [Alphaproteobacteria bacterium]
MARIVRLKSSRDEKIPVFVNPLQVTYITRAGAKNKNTKINFSDDHSVIVKGAAEYISNILAAAYKG